MSIVIQQKIRIFFNCIAVYAFSCSSGLLAAKVECSSVVQSPSESEGRLVKALCRDLNSAMNLDTAASDSTSFLLKFLTAPKDLRHPREDRVIKLKTSEILILTRLESLDHSEQMGYARIELDFKITSNDTCPVVTLTSKTILWNPDATGDIQGLKGDPFDVSAEGLDVLNDYQRESKNTLFSLSVDVSKEQEEYCGYSTQARFLNDFMFESFTRELTKCSKSEDCMIKNHSLKSLGTVATSGRSMKFESTEIPYADKPKSIFQSYESYEVTNSSGKKIGKIQSSSLRADFPPPEGESFGYSKFYDYFFNLVP